MASQTTAQNPAQTASDNDAERHWVRWVMQTARNWDDIASVVKQTDIDAIDDDHRKLTELTLQINNLLDSTSQDSRRFNLETIQKQRHILESLYSYSEHHFRREEDLIEKLGLPDGEKQRKQHEIFLGMLRTALDDFNQGRLTVSIHLKQWVLEWWVRHINEADYRTFCQENMVDRILANPDTWAHLIPLIKPTGVASIDVEHRHLIHVATDWVTALQTGQDGAPLLAELERCAREHFVNEERLIEQHGLPGIDSQQHQHGKFLETLQACAAEPVADPVAGIRLILNWWISHINDVDSISFSAKNLDEIIFDGALGWQQLDPFVLKTGVAALDAEHRIIAERMLELEADTDTATTLAKIDAMISLARHHFADEEAMMARGHSALLRVHADNHLVFLEILEGFRSDLAHGRLLVSRGLKRHLLSWWVRHIREYDMPAYGLSPTLPTSLSSPISPTTTVSAG